MLLSKITCQILFALERVWLYIVAMLCLLQENTSDRWTWILCNNDTY